MDDGQIGQNYKLRRLKKFTGKNLEALKSPNLFDMIDDYLERMGILGEEDRDFVLLKLAKVVSTNPAKTLPSKTSSIHYPESSDDSELVNVE